MTTRQGKSAVAPFIPERVAKPVMPHGQRLSARLSSYILTILPMVIMLCTIEILVQQPALLDHALRLSTWLPRGSLHWAVLDELAHGLAASYIWGTIARIYQERVHRHTPDAWAYAVAFIVGVSIDVDHYVWGAFLYRDISVERARHLGAVRPLPHCLPIMIVCAIFAAAAAHRCSRRWGFSHGVPLAKPSRGWLLLFLSAWSLHLLRDGIHRGVWLFPTSTALSTGLVPVPLYLVTACCTPMLLQMWLPPARRKKIKVGTSPATIV